MNIYQNFLYVLRSRLILYSKTDTISTFYSLQDKLQRENDDLSLRVKKHISQNFKAFKLNKFDNISSMS